MVMPRAFSSGALSIWSYAKNSAPPRSASTCTPGSVRREREGSDARGLQPTHLGDGGRERGLAVVHVPDGADVEMRFTARTAQARATSRPSPDPRPRWRAACKPSARDSGGQERRGAAAPLRRCRARTCVGTRRRGGAGPVARSRGLCPATPRRRRSSVPAARAPPPRAALSRPRAWRPARRWHGRGARGWRDEAWRGRGCGSGGGGEGAGKPLDDACSIERDDHLTGAIGDPIRPCGACASAMSGTRRPPPLPLYDWARGRSAAARAAESAS
eukprot:scaffold886_cov317-Prasinococcus_capsulatus_cf.AAC.18